MSTIEIQEVLSEHTTIYFYFRVLEHWIKFPRDIVDLWRDPKPN